jgi:predicted Rossmann-fold nucleotide-binding protein
MAAVSQGAAEAGGHVVGLTMKPWAEIQANRWVAEEIAADDWFDRLRRLAGCDAIVGLEGGLGTLAELSTTWANGQTDPGTNPPLILVGPAWGELVGVIGRLLVVDERDIGLVRLVGTVDEVPAMLDIVLRSDDRSGRRFG